MAHELAEHMEHAAHEAHGHGEGHGGGKSIAKYVGVTMAVLGVLLAFCSAMVGGARGSMIATMIRQTDAGNRYQAVATKYRLIESQLQQMHALLPTDPADAQKAEKELDGLEKQVAHGPAGPVLKASRTATGEILNSITPTRSDVMRFAEMMKAYEKEKEAAFEWAESYDGKVEAYTEAAEHYEWGLLMAEIGIVVASVALLLANRPAWIISVILGVLSAGTVAATFATSHRAISRAEAAIEKADQEYRKIDRDQEDDQSDVKLVEEIRKIPAW